jgi:hypothetical protein
MKIRFAIALVLAVVCLLPIVTGLSTAQQDELNKTNLDYKVYLPLVAKPPCTYIFRPGMYASVNKPVVRVGEIVTFTGVLVNDCTPVDKPQYALIANPERILSPSLIITIGYPLVVVYGSTQEVTFTAQATGTGVVTVSVGVSFESYPPDKPYPPWYFWNSATAAPIVMRVLP